MTGLWMGLVGRESLIAADDMWGLLVVMTMGVFFSIWLEQKYAWASKVSGAIIALIIAMVLANLGVRMGRHRSSRHPYAASPV